MTALITDRFGNLVDPETGEIVGSGEYVDILPENIGRTGQTSININKEALLAEWYNLQQQLKSVKEREMELRKELFKYYFPNPIVGKNKVDLPEKYKLVADYKQTIKMEYDAYKQFCDEYGEQKGVYFTDVVKYKPEFNEAMFKKLSAEKQDIIEDFLIRSPAAPSMEIIAPVIKK